MGTEPSEFGRGYATCLRQFANHRARLGEQSDLWTKMRDKHPDLFEEWSAVETWANGASDHLYELVRPPSGVSDEEWERARRLGDRGLAVGHGFRATSRSTLTEAVGLLNEAETLLALLEMPTANLDDALDADRALGLEPDAGSWNCPLDLRRDVVLAAAGPEPEGSVQPALRGPQVRGGG